MKPVERPLRFSLVAFPFYTATTRALAALPG